MLLFLRVYNSMSQEYWIDVFSLRLANVLARESDINIYGAT